MLLDLVKLINTRSHPHSHPCFHNLSFLPSYLNKKNEYDMGMKIPYFFPKHVTLRIPVDLSGSYSCLSQQALASALKNLTEIRFATWYIIDSNLLVGRTWPSSYKGIVWHWECQFLITDFSFSYCYSHYGDPHRNHLRKYWAWFAIEEMKTRITWDGLIKVARFSKVEPGIRPLMILICLGCLTSLLGTFHPWGLYTSYLWIPYFPNLHLLHCSSHS